MFLYRLLALAAAVGAAMPASAVAREAEPDICLSVAMIWRGTLEDVRRIVEVPVPESYRRNFAWSGCQNLIKDSLIDWHIAFGDERSTTAALHFLATTGLAGTPPIATFDTMVPTAWRDGEAAVRRHPPDPEASGPEIGRQQARLRRDGAIRRLAPLIVAQQRFAFFAAVYLRAAEFFRSRALLEEAGRYLAPADRAGDLLYEDGPSMAAGSTLRDAVGIAPRDRADLRDLRMRYAIARARITGLATDLAAAAATVAENDDAVLRAAIEPLIDRGEDYCQSITASDLLKSHCDDENDLPGRLRAFWQSKALVEMIGGAPPTASDRPFSAFDIAWRAIDADAGQTLPDRVRYDRATDDRVILLMARAEMNARRSQARDADAQTAAALRGDARTDLFRAERLTPPSLHPNRFRQIADQYLALFDREPQTTRTTLTEDGRQAAYLRQTLAGMVAINRGGR